jgi:hypothetical protein
MPPRRQPGGLNSLNRGGPAATAPHVPILAPAVTRALNLLELAAPALSQLPGKDGALPGRSDTPGAPRSHVRISTCLNPPHICRLWPFHGKHSIIRSLTTSRLPAGRWCAPGVVPNPLGRATLGKLYQQSLELVYCLALTSEYQRFTLEVSGTKAPPLQLAVAFAYLCVSCKAVSPCSNKLWCL